MTVGIEPVALVGSRSSVWGVDTARSNDGALLDAMFGRCSAATVYRRFFGQPSCLPSAYRVAVLAERPHVHDAVVVRYGDGLHIAGLASLATGAGPGNRAELGVLVADGWHRRGLGAAMVNVLVARARDRGVARIEAAVLPDRAQLLVALGRRLELERLVPSADTMSAVFRVTAPTVDRTSSDAADLRR
jgi:GNAT superfamily N-acetyltransferase